MYTLTFSGSPLNAVSICLVVWLWVCIPYSAVSTSIIPSPAVGGKESYSVTIYDIQNQFIGKKIFRILILIMLMIVL